MIKVIYKVYFIIGFLLVICIFSFKHYSFIETNMNYYEADSDYSDFYPIIDQFIYDTDAIFKIPFIIESKFDVVSVDYETNGFYVINKPEFNDKIVTIYLKNDGVTTNSSIKMIAKLSNGASLVSNLYSIIENNKVYLNKNSFDAARDIYLSELFENDIIDDDTYENILMKYNRKSIEINNHIDYAKIEKLRSSSGGWVSGTIRWLDDWNNWHPLQYTKLSIYDDDPLFNDLLGTTYTDENGEYIFSFDDNIDDEYDNSGRDIFIKVWSEGTNSVVKSGTNNEYFIKSDTYWNVTTGSTTLINIDILMNSDCGRAFQVSQAIITGARYASAMRGTEMERVNVRYPHNESSNSCFYRNINDTIYIIGNRAEDNYLVSGEILHSYASWDSIMHEYGHFVQDKLNIEDNPSGAHWMDINMYDHYMSHYNGGPVIPDCGGNCANPSAENAKTAAIKIAYAEAWPSILGAMAQQYYTNLEILDNNIQTVGDSKYESYNGANNNYNGGIRGGEAVESSIMGVLWDVYDDDIEPHDNISLGHNNWWNLTVGGSPKTFSSVASRFYSLYNSFSMWNSFNHLLECYKMSPENIESSDELVSHSLPTFSWLPNGTSSSLENNGFRVMIYDSNYYLLVDYYTVNASITLSQSQWNSVINSSGSQFYIMIGGRQTDGTVTGYYYSALYEFCKPLVQTSLINNRIEITGYYNWTPSNLNIPSEYSGYPTTSIGANAFFGSTSLERVVISSNIERIDSNAFKCCSSLLEVIVLKDTVPITTLGEHAFDDCDSNLEIKVPINRVADYKTSAYWSSYSDRIVPNIPITSTIDIDCLTEDDIEIQLNANENKYYKLAIDCGKSYQFVADDLNDVTITIYNSNMALIYSNSENNNNNTLTGFLSPGIYYLKIEYASIYDYGLFTLEYSPTYLITNSALVFGTNNIQNNIHSFNNNKKHGYFSYSHTLGEGFFKFSLNGGYNNNYPANAITIYTNNNKTNALARYPINNSINAISNINENELYVYIPSNGTYYIDLLLYASNSLNTTFTISNLDISIMDYTNNLQFLSFNFVFEEQDTFSYFKEVSILHKSKMQIDINSLGTTSDDIPIYLYKREIEPGNDPGNIHYSYTLISNTSWKITSNTSSPLYTIVLDAGTYYLGYSNNINHIDITIALRRVVDYDASSLGTLITDPSLNQGYTLGSEVNFNGGLPQDTTITEGFTRCIYLMFDNFIELPDSRLDYDWYSSNDSVASVTHYGTVLGKPVNTNTNVRINAVLKEDPSVVFSIELTILDDTETDEIEIVSNLSYSYSTENGIYQLALDNLNSPYPWINYYIWAIDIANDYPNLEVEMNQWGYITSNGTGEAIITANYHLNPRVYLTIYLTITT